MAVAGVRRDGAPSESSASGYSASWMLIHFQNSGFTISPSTLTFFLSMSCSTSLGLALVQWLHSSPCLLLLCDNGYEDGAYHSPEHTANI